MSGAQCLPGPARHSVAPACAGELPSTGPERSGDRGLAPDLAHIWDPASGDSSTCVKLDRVGEGFLPKRQSPGPDKQVVLNKCDKAARQKVSAESY